MVSVMVRERLRSLGLLPHQIDFVEEVLDPDSSARFVLVAPVGSGKSFGAAGLIGEMMRSRGADARALVLAPPPLLEQWADRLSLLSSEHLLATIVNGPAYRKLEAQTNAEQSPWEKAPLAVVSFDFAKSESRIKELAIVTWDIVVIDEAHRCASGPLRRSLLEAIWKSQSARLCVAMTSTGEFVRNDPIFGSPSTSIIRQSLGDLRDWNGEPLLRTTPNRHVTVLAPELSYNEISFGRAVLKALSAQQSDDPSNKFLSRIVLNRLASSLFAIEQTLRRRARRLSQPDLLQNHLLAADQTLVELGLEEESVDTSTSRLDEATCWSLLDQIDEIEADHKWTLCKKVIEGAFEQKKAVAVFSEFADTANYLWELCNDEGWITFLVTGAQVTFERRGNLKQFEDCGDILISTWAASEGSDLSSVDCVIHYDLPLRIATLMQRFGRFERISRQSNHVSHVVVPDGFVIDEERALELIRALEKVDEEDLNRYDLLIEEFYSLESAIQHHER